MSGMTRREFLRATLAATAAAALTACGPTPTPTPTKVPPTPTKAAAAATPTKAPAAPTPTTAPAGKALPADAAPASQQVLRAQFASQGATYFGFEPTKTGSDFETWMPLFNLPPMYFDAAFKDIKPGVFTSWEPNKDYTQWTFKLDPKAKFSDNSPLTAADVKGTWEIITDPDTQAGRAKSYLGNIKGFADLKDKKAQEMTGLKVIDDRTLQVTLDKPDPVFHYRIATCHLAPIKASLAKGKVTTWWLPQNKPVWSGPYVLSAYDPDKKEATAVKNPNWWKDEGPYLEKIEFRFVADAETVATMFQNNQLDASPKGPVSLTLKPKYPDLFRTVKAVGFNLFFFRPMAEPTDDVNVRKALILSLNFQDIFKAAFPEGDAEFIAQLIDPDIPCKEANPQWYKQDIAAAKAALAASKWGSAERLPKLRVCPRGSWPPMNRALEVCMEQWRKNLGITNIEFKQAQTEWGPDARKLNLLRDDIVVRFPDAPTYLRTGVHSQGEMAFDPGGDAVPIAGGYKNAKVDELIDQALTLATTDPKRCELALQAQKLFMDDYMVIFFGKPLSYLTTRDYVKNLIFGPDRGVIEPWKIYIAKH